MRPSQGYTFFRHRITNEVHVGILKSGILKRRWAVTSCGIWLMQRRDDSSRYRPRRGRTDYERSDDGFPLEHYPHVHPCMACFELTPASPSDVSPQDEAPEAHPEPRP